jgi:hypothetical protein
MNTASSTSDGYPKRCPTCGKKFYADPPCLMCSSFAKNRQRNNAAALTPFVTGTYSLLDDTLENRRAAEEIVVEQERCLNERRAQN